MPRNLSRAQVEAFRARLCAVAQERFARQGVEGVSMRQLADELGCSPMTPYRYFRNKEEIIRALFGQQFARWDELYALPDDRLPRLDDLQQLVRATFVTGWDYRFIYRELIALLRRDEQLQRPARRQPLRLHRGAEGGDVRPLVAAGHDHADQLRHSCVHGNRMIPMVFPPRSG